MTTKSRIAMQEGYKAALAQEKQLEKELTECRREIKRYRKALGIR